jgi:hypothetical protein
MATANQNQTPKVRGQGRLFYRSSPRGDLQLWTGGLMLNDGTDCYIKAKAILSDDPHFECEVQKISGEVGKPWKTIATITMPAFPAEPNAKQRVKLKEVLPENAKRRPKVIAEAEAQVRNLLDEESQVEGQFIHIKLDNAPKARAMVPTRSA